MMMVPITLVAIATAGTTPFNPNLKYFSLWSVEAESTAKLVSWVNFIFTSSDPALIRQHHAAGMGPSMIHVRSTFFCGASLCPDYESKWSTLLNTTIQPMLDEGSLMGIFFGDEICWSCTPWSNLSAAVDLVRASLPRGKAILYYNEAFPVLSDSVCDSGGDFHHKYAVQRHSLPAAAMGGNAHRRPMAGLPFMTAACARRWVPIDYPRVPAGLDWVSLDYYPDEGTIAGAKQLYTEHLYPKMADGQLALYVPPAYGAATVADRNLLCCSNNTRDGPNPPCNGNCTLAMLQWAQGAYDWARTDERIVGLNPWHYTSGDPARFQPGLNGMPAVLEAYQKIGQEIISGKQRDLRLV
jgi:hypothetical protein